jgi:hypothetical protein
MVVALACGGDTRGEVGPGGPEADLVGPIIEHDPIDEPQGYLQDIFLEASVTDDPSGVFIVEVAYQQETAASGAWTTKVMNEVGGGLFQGRIQGDNVASSGMRYFIRAIDAEDNMSCLPEDCEDDPWYFSVVP